MGTFVQLAMSENILNLAGCYDILNTTSSPEWTIYLISKTFGIYNAITGMRVNFGLVECVFVANIILY